MKKLCIIDGRDNPDIDFKTEISHLFIRQDIEKNYDHIFFKKNEQIFQKAAYETAISLLKKDPEYIKGLLINIKL